MVGSLAGSAGASSRADLVVKTLSGAPNSIEPGSSFSVADTTANKGKKKAPATQTNFVLSTDTVAGGGDVELTVTRSVPALKSKKKSEGSSNVSVPLATAPGPYFVIACADGQDDVRESKEANNCLASATQTTVAGVSLPPTDTPPVTPPLDTTAPSAPVLTTTTPASPSNSNSPSLQGSAEAGALISVHTSSVCSGAVATGTTSQLQGAGIAVNVPADATTQLFAQATDAAGNVSPCSTGLSYVEDSTAPQAPILVVTDPQSPSQVDNPKLQGGAETGSEITVYTSSVCLGSPLSTGTNDELEGAGITVQVAADSSTQLFATATDAAGNVSPCSSGLTYVEDSTAPDTTIDSGPSGGTNDATPTWTFSSSEPGSTFLCRLDAGSFGACSGPGDSHTTATLSQASHTFQVMATDAAGNADATPASRTILVDTDQDNDGFSPPADCNDTNAAINPAASDTTMNGTDEDCDGVDGS